MKFWSNPTILHIIINQNDVYCMVNGEKMTSFRKKTQNIYTYIDINLSAQKVVNRVHNKCWIVSVYINFMLNFIDWYIGINRSFFFLVLSCTNNIESDTFRHHSKWSSDFCHWILIKCKPLHLSIHANAISL